MSIQHVLDDGVVDAPEHEECRSLRRAMFPLRHEARQQTFKKLHVVNDVEQVMKFVLMNAGKAEQKVPRAGR